MHRYLRLRSLALFGGIALTASACGDDGGPTNNVGPEPVTLEIAGGDGQSAPVSTAVPVAPMVRVLDDAGGPVPNVTVTFEVVSGGGSVTGATPKTGSSGHASVGSWTLGAAGGQNTLRATVQGLTPVLFTATAQAPTAAPAELTLVIGGGQTAQVATPIPVAPAVRVTDAEGDPVAFATVTFAVQSGGGSVTGGVQTTDADGVARVGSWKLGPNPGVNTLRATVNGVAPLDVTATGRAIDAGGFNITLRFLTGITAQQLAVFEAARTRWEGIITGELTDLPVANTALCNGTPSTTETIDDVVIFVVLDEIDGPGSVLGAAGPCAIRNSNGLPIAGIMTFDVADLEAMSESLFRDVILHEMGHVLGIGSLWDQGGHALISGKGGDDPFFTGAGAIAAFDLAGGAGYAGNKVPVENTGGPGTRDSHWRETVGPGGGLGHELMTGFVSATSPNPLSAITIASLADMGYVVDAAQADAYTWSASVRLNAGEVLVPMNEAPLTAPIQVMDESGRVRGTIPRR